MTDDATEVTQASLVAQMAAMQERMNAMSIAQGIPVDPIDGHVLAIQAHTKVQADAHPNHDLSELLKAVDLGEDRAVTTEHVEWWKAIFDGYREQYAPIIHELSYVGQLINELHRLVLKSKVSA